jgi:hypothetical protein
MAELHLWRHASAGPDAAAGTMLTSSLQLVTQLTVGGCAERRADEAGDKLARMIKRQHARRFAANSSKTPQTAAVICMIVSGVRAHALPRFFGRLLRKRSSALCQQ